MILKIGVVSEGFKADQPGRDGLKGKQQQIATQRARVNELGDGGEILTRGCHEALSLRQCHAMTAGPTG